MVDCLMARRSYGGDNDDWISAGTRGSQQAAPRRGRRTATGWRAAAGGVEGGCQGGWRPTGEEERHDEVEDNGWRAVDGVEGGW
jgi:hypothetical protein